MGVLNHDDTVPKAAEASSKNWWDTESITGTTAQENLEKKSSERMNTIHYSTGISLTNFGKKRKKKSRQNKGKGGNATSDCMTFRRDNQKTRRRVEKAQAGILHPLRTVPPLPPSSRVYISHCISRPGRHNCSIHCESEIIGVYSYTHYLYILD